MEINTNEIVYVRKNGFKELALVTVVNSQANMTELFYYHDPRRLNRGFPSSLRECTYGKSIVISHINFNVRYTRNSTNYFYFITKINIVKFKHSFQRSKEIQLEVICQESIHKASKLLVTEDQFINEFSINKYLLKKDADERKMFMETLYKKS